jgi:hypothetical protein
VAGFTDNLKKEGVKKGAFSQTWQKQGHNNVLVSQALDALKLPKKQQMTLKNQALTTLLAKQGMEEMGWKFDPNKSRADQIKGLAKCEFRLVFVKQGRAHRMRLKNNKF